MHEIKPPDDNVLWVKVNGKLTREEYADLVPSWEAMIARHGKFRLLFQMLPDFAGWEAGAAMDDMKFSVSHQNEMERVAVVGAKKWHEMVAKFSKLIVNSEIRFFEDSEIEQALAWLHE